MIAPPWYTLIKSHVKNVRYDNERPYRNGQQLTQIMEGGIEDSPWLNPYRALGTVMQSLRSHLDPIPVKRQVP